MPTTPDRQALRALYDEAVTQINGTRLSVNLTTGFYAETGDSVFEAGYLALSDYCAFQKSPERRALVSHTGLQAMCDHDDRVFWSSFLLNSADPDFIYFLGPAVMAGNPNSHFSGH